MMIKIVALLAGKAKEFKAREEGLALTEYVVVLGLLIAGVVGSVLIFGDALDDVWTAWGTFMGDIATATNTAISEADLTGGDDD